MALLEPREQGNKIEQAPVSGNPELGRDFNRAQENSPRPDAELSQEAKDKIDALAKLKVDGNAYTDAAPQGREVRAELPLEEAKRQLNLILSGNQEFKPTAEAAHDLMELANETTEDTGVDKNTLEGAEKYAKGSLN
jgi:hypothetical protein